MRPSEIFRALTPDALRALEQTGLSRREFMKSSGVMIVGFGTMGLTAHLDYQASSLYAQGH